MDPTQVQQIVGASRVWLNGCVARAANSVGGT